EPPELHVGGRGTDDAWLPIAGADIEESVAIRRLAGSEAIRAVHRESVVPAVRERVAERVDELIGRADGDIADRRPIGRLEGVPAEAGHQRLQLRACRRSAGAGDAAGENVAAEKLCVLSSEIRNLRVDARLRRAERHERLARM